MIMIVTAIPKQYTVPKERSPCLNGGVTLVAGSETPESGPTILVDFKIVMFSYSILTLLNYGTLVAGSETPESGPTILVD